MRQHFNCEAEVQNAMAACTCKPRPPAAQTRAAGKLQGAAGAIMYGSMLAQQRKAGRTTACLSSTMRQTMSLRISRSCISYLHQPHCL